MAEEPRPADSDGAPDAPEKSKNQWKLNTLILAGVLLLSAVLPREYRAYAPLLFVVPFIIGVANKMRQAGENPSGLSSNPTHAPGAHDGADPQEPYSYRPKDPGDPRKYKPIG